jgi:hypothetical protein
MLAGERLVSKYAFIKFSFEGNDEHVLCIIGKNHNTRQGVRSTNIAEVELDSEGNVLTAQTRSGSVYRFIGNPATTLSEVDDDAIYILERTLGVDRSELLIALSALKLAKGMNSMKISDFAKADEHFQKEVDKHFHVIKNQKDEAIGLKFKTITAEIVDLKEVLEALDAK